MPLLPNLIKTPAGSSSSAAGILTLFVTVILPPIWPWWAHQSTTWKGAVVTVLVFVSSYLGVWWKVMHAKGQHLTLELTKSFLPTVQVHHAAALPAPVPAQAPVPSSGGRMQAGWG